MMDHRMGVEATTPWFKRAGEHLAQELKVEEIRILPPRYTPWVPA